jgi:hypothetical protein
MRLLKLSVALSLTSIVAAAPLAEAEESRVEAAARALSASAELLPAKARATVRQRALQLALLDREGRLVPSAATPEEVEALVRCVLVETPSYDARVLSGLPPADTVIFNGSRLSGGNFLNVDAIVGADGRPIALDRQLPAILVPLAAEDASSLNASGEVFRNEPASVALAADIDRVYHAPVAARFVADGVAVRPYAGRIDDLYFHLVQEGSTSSCLDFYAILESLAGRRYDPVTGMGVGSDVPAVGFSLSDLLSGGGFHAVQKFRTSHPNALARNPFSGFGVRLLPFLGETLRTAAVGSDLSISRETVKLALTNPRRFAPAPVAPIFQDRSRFLGGDFSGFTRVGSKGLRAESFSEQIAEVEAEVPLPEKLDDPSVNALLIDTNPEAIAPDPPPIAAEVVAASEPMEAPAGRIAISQKVDLLPPAHGAEDLSPDASIAAAEPPITAEDAPAAPDAQPSPDREPAVLAAIPVTEPAEPQPVAPPEPVKFQVAVLTPTAAQAEAYVEAIAASDAKLTANAAELNRAACYLRWFKEALQPIEAALSENPGLDAEARNRLAAVTELSRAEMASLIKRSGELRSERLAEITARVALRRDLEQTIRTERTETLRSLAGTRA